MLPLKGCFDTTSSAEVDYTIGDTDVMLKIDNWFFDPMDLSELIDFLTSVKAHLENK